MITQKDRSTVRELAAKWRELASLPVMQQRKRIWRAVHDLRAERPVILFETAWIDGFVAESELLCEDPFLRSIEKDMRITLRQAEELGDDLVVEPYYRLGWKMVLSDYGVPVEIRSAKRRRNRLPTVSVSRLRPPRTSAGFANERSPWTGRNRCGSSRRWRT